MKRYLVAALLLSIFFQQDIFAQSGTNSPYSQFGLGVLSDQSAGFNRGMNGLALGFHESNQVNFQNPASYASIDSLTFLFDAGVAGQITHFKEGAQQLNAKNANFEYVVAGFRAFKHFGVGFGLVPYTNIGYNYHNNIKVDDIIATNTYNGEGGLHQAFIGIGWEPFNNFSIGVNGSYLYGNYTKTVVNNYNNNYANSLTKRYQADIRNYKIDFGLQYTINFLKKNALTLGLTYGLGHIIGGNPNFEVISTNPQSSVADTTLISGNGATKFHWAIPHTYGAGIMLNINNLVKLGVDYSLQKWEKVGAPGSATDSEGNVTYIMRNDQFRNRHKVTLGTDICPRELGRSLFQRMHYRAGVSYSTPYYYINGHNGPKELSASIGFGIPIINGYNNRSILNISGQWVRRSAVNFITENSFRINIGLTFNERWFAQWKVQ